ncbi:hypothetical protein BU23DRAFT_599798 [Bimuria novae-zelandiae CBS 107.79]|uniref:Galactose oxidase n=1 Tax=Bimuria novae-zelandiae CBS 107.79 TaxID=1447943 RepID=A0A6A5V4X2_9PLEO|nr:hypothetical protein BU23DRAFT_599798 [Bimuria novae-zelandiae CBS 107.79]
MLNNLISFDTKTNQWVNQTYDPTPRAGGDMHYIPASKKGMLVYFGGIEFRDGKEDYDIHIFDIANSRWFIQKAAGDLPQPRSRFCSVVVWAKDYASYNIYVYGGMTSTGASLNDAYVISLPDFEWIPVRTLDVNRSRLANTNQLFPDPMVQSFPDGKLYPSCNLYQNSQMLVIAGANLNPERHECDTDGGQHGFLLGQESIERKAQWAGLGPNITSYRGPDNIVAVVGGGTGGHATATAPASGWGRNWYLDYCFRTSYLASPVSATRYLSHSSPPLSRDPTPSALSQPERSHTGATAGGTVGGVILGVFIAAIAFYCLLRRRSKKQNSPVSSSEHATRTAPLYPSELPSPFSPLQDPLQSPSEHAHGTAVELPGAENQVSEMPEGRDPAPKVPSENAESKGDVF